MSSTSASPPSGRKNQNNSSSKNNSPTNSPKQGKSRGRLRLPQLGKNKLSNSKENLDGSKENNCNVDQILEIKNVRNAHLDQVVDDTDTANCSGGDNKGVRPEVVANTELIVVNGVCHNKQQNGFGSCIINGECESNTIEDVSADDQRDSVRLKPLYNLYAISVRSAI